MLKNALKDARVAAHVDDSEDVLKLDNVSLGKISRGGSPDDKYSLGDHWRGLTFRSKMRTAATLDPEERANLVAKATGLATSGRNLLQEGLGDDDDNGEKDE